MERCRLPSSILVRIFFRTFLLQASWNFERLQSLGVVYILAPALRRFYRDEELLLACARHMEYFNTHPFLASPILGTTIALEEQRSRGEESYLGAAEFKKMIMAPYAAMGDAFFWGGVRPLAAGVGLFLAWKGSLWGPLVFLLLFNGPHLWFRSVGLLRGYALGLKVVDSMQRHHLPDLAIRCKEAMVILLGALCAYLTFGAVQRCGIGAGWGLAAIPLVALFGWLNRRGCSSLMLIMTVCAVLLAIGRLFE